MKNINSRSPFFSDKHLVVEQPGLVLFFFTVLLAFFLGSVFKAIFSANQVREKIEQASKNVHKDVQFQFTEAFISLSDGFWPRFAVVVKDIKVLARNDCWMNPELSVDQLEMPLSIFALIRNRSPIESLQINEANLVFKSPWKECKTGDTLAPTTNPAQALDSSFKKPLSVTANSSASSSPKAIESEQAPVGSVADSRLKHLNIQKLTLRHQFYSEQQDVEFADIRVKVLEGQPLQLVLDAKTHLLKDNLVGDYLSHANLHLEYKTQPEPVAQLHFFGHWREGHYSVVSNYNLLDQKLIVETEVKHIPLSQILELLQNFKIKIPNYNLKQMWASFRAKTEGFTNSNQWPVSVSDFEIEGDIGELSIENLQLDSVQPLRYQPFTVKLNHLSLDHWIVISNQPSPAGYFGKMGALTGKARWVSENEIYFNGLHEGIEFVFSNRGQREIQSVEQIQCNIRRINDKITVRLSQFKLPQSNLDADVEINANADLDTMSINTQIRQWDFGDKIQKLLTGDGSIGSLQAKMNIQVQKGLLQKMEGYIKSSSVDVEGVVLQEPQWMILGGKDNMKVQFKATSLEVKPLSVAFPLIEPLQKSIDQGADKNWKAYQLKSNVEVQSTQKIQWKNFSAVLGADKKSKFTSDGGWGEDGTLYGEVRIKGLGANKFNWQIVGRRDSPQLQSVGAK
ncbi:MAG: hypothetical protein ACOYOK_03750 [Pseudobdellovibrionaceae bacterium]